MRRADLIVAVALVVGGLLTIGVAIPRFVAGAPLGGGLSPAFMPYVAAGLMTLAALGLVLEAARTRDADASPGARLTLANLRFLAACAAVLVASYALMSRFGYVVGGIALVAGFLALARVRPVPLAVAAVVTPVALWLLFVELLAMPLP